MGKKKGFNWGRFDSEFIQSIVYSDKTAEKLRAPFQTDDKELLVPYMEKICNEPDQKFILRYHEEIADHFLADSGHLRGVVGRLKGRHNRADNQEAVLKKIRTRNKLFFLDAAIVRAVVEEMYNVGYRAVASDGISQFTEERRLKLHNCVPAEVPMYDYQVKAIQTLQEFYIEKNERAGILHMPTGSGKTRVATCFLLEHMVASGWQVIWLAHQSLLLEQAAQDFYEHSAALLPTVAPNRDSFQMICVSGSHANIRDTRKNHDVLLFSIQTLARMRNVEYLRAILRDRVIIVIDEAHRAEAPSYRKVIKAVSDLSANVKLLGLTATPKRFTDSDTAHLMELFDNKIIYSISMAELILKDVLSRPKLFRIDTNINYYDGLTKEEKDYLEKYGKLSPKTARRIVETKARNELIVKTYLDRRNEFGKTLIFALNGEHCKALNNALRANGVRSDYIYCKEPGDNEKIELFRNGELDVLLNIEKFTEGVDVPDIQTVFLTRPTGSDRLLVQMVGRGMRGVGSGGTKTVNIVDFHDMWGRFEDWLTPHFEFPVQYDESDTESETTTQSETSSAKAEQTEKESLELIREFYEELEINLSKQVGQPAYVALPVGWYDVLDADGNDSKVLVFDSQYDGYQAMWSAVERFPEDYSGKDALAEWFDGFGLLPSAYELQLLLDYYQDSGEAPVYHTFDQRDAIDASLLAKQLYQENVGVADLNGRIHERYEENAELIDSIYGSEAQYIRRVKDFMEDPGGIRPLGVKIEELPYDILPFDPSPVYDIHELVNEVDRECFQGKYGKKPTISWTKKPYRSYFGEFSRNTDGAQYIRINRILDSKDVPREDIKYVIYHEMLHRDNMTHNADFRAKEHLFPNWPEMERFLDSTFRRFDLQCAFM